MSGLIFDLPVIIFPQEVFRYLGYKADRSKLSGNIERKIYQMIDEYRPSIKCRGIYKTFPVHKDSETIYFANTDYSIAINALTEKFAMATQISVLAVTLGEVLDDKISELFAQDEYTRAVVLDAIGSDAVEQGANHLNEMLRQEAYQNNYQLTQRFSPGYGRWPVENQKELLELVEGNKIDISLTDGYMLIPQKTITAVVGWIPFEEDESMFIKDTVKCDNCQFNCEFKSS